MEAILGIAFIFGTWYAVNRGTEYAVKAFKNLYRKKIKAWAAKNPKAPTPAGVKVGAGLAAALTGSLAVGRGFVAGVKVGWPEGRSRGQAWALERAQRRADAAQPEAGTPATASRKAHPGTVVPPAALDDVPVPHAAAGTGTGTGTGTSANGWSQPVLAGKTARALKSVPAGSRSAPVPATPAADAPDVPAASGTTHTTSTTTTEEGHRMTSTVTGGETSTMDALIAELQNIATEATAELEDAQADRQRAIDAERRVELMVASLRAVDVDATTLGEVGAIGEAETLRRQAAEQRAQAAEARLIQAQTAVKGVQARHNLMREAHAVTPDPAKREFYVG
jgi:hypothetical protein